MPIHSPLLKKPRLLKKLKNFYDLVRRMMVKSEQQKEVLNLTTTMRAI